MSDIRGIKKPGDDTTTISVEENIGTLYVLPDNAQHIGSREEQQDYFSYSDVFDIAQIEKLGCVAVMADGMGGLDNGREAAMCGVEQFISAYEEKMQGENPDILLAMGNALVTANEAVTQYPDAGATLIGAVVKDNSLYWVSVGDSRIYLLRKGLLRQLNEEHNYAKELDELVSRGEIELEAALNHPERNALTSYLGLPELTQVDYNEQSFPLRAGDTILICSDGLYGTLSDAEITNIIMSDEERKDTAEKLVYEALIKQKPHQDNVTVVLLKII